MERDRKGGCRSEGRGGAHVVPRRPRRAWFAGCSALGARRARAVSTVPNTPGTEANAAGKDEPPPSFTLL